MNNLQINTNGDYIIIFSDGSKKQISAEYGEKLLNLSGTKQTKFTLAGQLYSFSNVSKLLPIQEYYQQYPETRPEQVRTFENYPQASFSKEKRIHAIKSMVKGVEKHIASSNYQGTNKPQKLINKMLFKIRLIENEEAGTEKPFNPAQLIYGGL